MDFDSLSVHSRHTHYTILLSILLKSFYVTFATRADPGQVIFFSTTVPYVLTDPSSFPIILNYCKSPNSLTCQLEASSPSAPVLKGDFSSVIPLSRSISGSFSVNSASSASFYSSFKFGSTQWEHRPKFRIAGCRCTQFSGFFSSPYSGSFKGSSSNSISLGFSS